MKKAIIIGAGPAGLTAAYELLKETDIKPVIYEKSSDIGGISKTVNYKGNRIDIGGHRFFSKSKRVMDFWFDLFPLQGKLSKDDSFLGREIPLSNSPEAPDPEEENIVMLIRNRLSRIFYLQKFFDYPISLSLNTIKNLGLVRMIKIGLSYIKIRLFPIRNEKNLADFFTNRFGKELYLTFFKDYTEKLWGIDCTEISPDWGAQRIKGLSISKMLIHLFKSTFSRSKDNKNVETSLIEQFYYPKLGPGQLWETLADKIVEMGGEIHKECKAVKIQKEEDKIKSVTIRNEKDNSEETVECDYLISTMPIRELISNMEGDDAPSGDVKEVAEGLQYRDFITIGVLANKLKIKNQTKIKTVAGLIPDTWIYIQEREVKLGRLQIFNNWSPYMVENFDNVWVGLEYFCSEGDELWEKPDDEMIQLGIDELEKINIINKEDVLDHTIIKVEKAYPAYFGTFKDFDIVKRYVDNIDNLFLIGRNGMHRYNNMDHSMLTAIEAVNNIKTGNINKYNIWNINSEQDYHEKK